jgi:hypothetical protein
VAAMKTNDDEATSRANRPRRPGRELRLDYLGPPGEVTSLARALRGAGIGVRYRPPLTPTDAPAMLTTVVLTLVAPDDGQPAETAVRRITDRFTATCPGARFRLAVPPLATLA